MTYLSVAEIITHCNRQIERLHPGSNAYAEHVSVLTYLRELLNLRRLVNSELQRVQVETDQGSDYSHLENADSYEEFWFRMLGAAAMENQEALNIVYEDMLRAGLDDDEITDLMNLDMDIRFRRDW